MVNDSSSTPKQNTGKGASRAASSERPASAEKSEREKRAQEAQAPEAAEESFEELEPTQFDDDEPPQRRVDPEWDDADEDDSDEGDEPTGDAEDEEAEESGADEDDFEDEEPEPAAVETGAGEPAGARRGSGQREPARARPAGRGGAPARGPSPREERRPPPSSAEELLLSEIPYRLGRAEQKLRQNLAGRIALRITSGPERRSSDSRNSESRNAESRGTETRYLFDWSGDSPSIKKQEAGAPKDGGEQVTPDCTISIHEQVLLRIANGELNPQITMLSDRLKIDGQSSLGIYFFNLVAPPS